MNFHQRSYQPELLDDDDIPFHAIKKNMQELEVINKWLGGHHITVNGFQHFIAGNKKLSVCEIGCGGGDNLKALYRFAAAHHIQLELIGIDIKAECITYANENCSDLPNATWICADYKSAALPYQPDIIFSSLFCHHFKDSEVTGIFSWMMKHARLGCFINDLHRHPLAYYSIKFLTQIFSGSYLVKNDAPLSVRRGFSRRELNTMISGALQEAPLWKSQIYWKWAFRWLVVFYKTPISSDNG